jgi:chromosomal replication initiator protein
MDVVASFRSLLEQRLGAQRFGLWFGGDTQVSHVDGQIRLSVGSPTLRDWIQRQFRTLLDDCAAQVAGPGTHVHLLVADRATSVPVPEPPPAGDEHSAQEAGRAAVARTQLAALPQRADVPLQAAPIGSGCQVRGPAAPQSAEAAPRSAPAARTSGNGLPRRPLASLESYVVGDCNRLAVASAHMVVQQPGRCSPLFVYGPTSVGKTRLLEAIYAAVRQRHRLPCVFLTAEQFTAEFLAALHGGGMPSFRSKFRSIDLLVLDDLQFLCGKQHTLRELLHTLDHLHRTGKQVVCAADRPPAELRDLGAELRTRLQGGMLCPLDPPGHDVRRGLLKQLLREMDWSLPDDVEQFLVERIATHARDLAGALYTLRAHSVALGRRIDRPLAEAVLAERLRSVARPIRLPDIERAVCRAFDLQPDDLHSARKSRNVSYPRMLAMWLARKYTRSALSEIGQFFGRRSHSTVASAHRKVRCWMEQGAVLELGPYRVTVDEAVRRVEATLQVG